MKVPAAGRRPWRLLAWLATIAGVLALTGSCVAVGRLHSRWANPDRITINYPQREPLPGGPYEFDALSADGALYTVIRERNGEPADQMLLVVDAVRATIVGRLSGATTGGSLRYSGWRSSDTVWVGAVELSAGRCTASFSASAPAWEFAADDCRQSPENAGSGFEYRTESSPDGTLVAKATYDRSRGFKNSYPVSDVRLEAQDDRFLAQFGNLTLVGWAADGSLIVIDDSDHRPYRITRPEIDSFLDRG